MQYPLILLVSVVRDLDTVVAAGEKGKTVRAERRETINAKTIQLVALPIWLNRALPKEHCVNHNCHPWKYNGIILLHAYSTCLIIQTITQPERKKRDE